VVRQAVLLYGVSEENEMDENKDVYNGQLMPIEEIFVPDAHENMTVVKERSP